ncbi:tRNA glutamyl-Q(34) synthetase GluQRS [Methylobacterium haplocladii]|uniref:tRNA glutamyl-Q(34) synthetase GluQRS n=1 Tax=Methylobacterium haplocladii TaxID=1176176 RepID=A0A512IPQ2_9HYPH|nr:tRNA glutamyl-Q(34) synthetase GluQRS [Methylobacterium haplocladii]GJD85076.1 Glutamate--tRNA ligase [Methylobacterium haplocladii]GLS61149.1 tRNA glutamyl-Q(34) synthetase GluQRS [Methylobacterium haplocladii]
MTEPVLRFAPSPNGRLHLGHAYSALLNWEVAVRLAGRCLLRIEDIDPGRSRPELIVAIEEDLAWLGLSYARPVRRQSEHLGFYREALEGLIRRGLAYPCFCSRGTIAARVAELEGQGRAVQHDPDGAPLYPGTCRSLSSAQAEARIAGGDPHTWRLDMMRALAMAPQPHRFRCFAASDAPSAGAGTLPPLRERGTPSLGTELPSADPRSREGHPLPLIGEGMRVIIENEHEATADPARWGDAVIARRDVPTSYHLSVVLDDDAQGITHVVRGEDLRAATDLHVLLQRLLGLSSPAYCHHRLLLAESGEKLAKSRGSESLGDLRARGVTAEKVREKLGF